MVEKWIQSSLLDVTKPAVICIDNPIEMGRLPAYGTSETSQNYRYIIPGTYPIGTYYPPYCKGSYIVTAPAIQKLLDTIPTVHRNNFRLEGQFPYLV